MKEHLGNLKMMKISNVIFLKEVRNPSEFGIAWLDEKGSITHMLEKPEKPDSNMAITGLYFYSQGLRINR